VTSVTSVVKNLGPNHRGHGGHGGSQGGLYAVRRCLSKPRKIL